MSRCISLIFFTKFEKINNIIYMPTNPLKLIINLNKAINRDINHNLESKNKMNQVGMGLELFIKNLFCFSENLDKDYVDYEEFFSYNGNSSNPPDLMLRNSDAIEIKKIESPNSSLALNSSYPKDKLKSSSALINNTCRTCEEWNEKDMLYIVGTIPDKKPKILSRLWLVYGDCYCAKNEIYINQFNKLSAGISTIQGIEFSKTKELGKVKKIDPLGITDLRIRGMWNIENPNKVFSYLDQMDVNFLVLNSKYQTFPEVDRNEVEENKNIKITSIKIKDPNNPAKLLEAKLIQLCLN
jgi:NgoPII restriction endonuclease